MKIVSEKLDEITEESLHLMEEYTECKILMEKELKKGYLSLAKSRYIMGTNNVSSLQLPTVDGPDLLATYRVMTFLDSFNGTEEFGLLDLQSTDVEFETRLISRHQKSHHNEICDGGSLNPAACSVSGLPSSVPDTLKWFGVMVPNELKQCQSKFIELLDVVIRCANIHKKILINLGTYKKYLKEKDLCHRN